MADGDTLASRSSLSPTPLELPITATILPLLSSSSVGWRSSAEVTGGNRGGSSVTPLPPLIPPPDPHYQSTNGMLSSSPAPVSFRSDENESQSAQQQQHQQQLSFRTDETLSPRLPVHSESVFITSISEDHMSLPPSPRPPLSLPASQLPPHPPLSFTLASDTRSDEEPSFSPDGFSAALAALAVDQQPPEEQTSEESTSNNITRTGGWRPPPYAVRVGSFIRDMKLTLHLRMCARCRDEHRTVRESRHEYYAKHATDNGARFQRGLDVVTSPRSDQHRPPWLPGGVPRPRGSSASPPQTRLQSSRIHQLSPTRPPPAPPPAGFKLSEEQTHQAAETSSLQARRSVNSTAVPSQSTLPAEFKRSEERTNQAAGKKCSSLCVHLSTSSTAVLPPPPPLRPPPRPRPPRPPLQEPREETTPVARRVMPFKSAGILWKPTEIKDVELPGIKHLSIYHRKDFSQMTWEELMRFLTTNYFAQPKEVSKIQIKCLMALKQDIIEAVQKKQIVFRDTRLKWKNRKMILELELSKLLRTRDIYRLVQEALFEHNVGLRRLVALVEVRAYGKVHALKVDYLKSGCSLMRFTQIPGQMCRGITLYQACIAVVVGRRWANIVLEKKLARLQHRISEVNAEIGIVLQYKLEKLPEDKMRVTNLLHRLEALTEWFGDVKQQMVGTVEKLYSELEERRSRQLHTTVVDTIDACVDGEPHWGALYDFNRCLAGLCRDMSARNAMLRRIIADTRSAERRRGQTDAQWRSWILQERRPPVHDAEHEGEEQEGVLRIRRKSWLPV